MAADKYGYRNGPQCLVSYGVDSTGGTINAGDHVKMVTDGYVGVCGSGDTPIGVAVSNQTAGSADGDTTVLVDVSEWSLFEYPPASGTVTVALIGKTCDLGGARSIDITASTDDNIIIVNVDTTANTLLVRHSYPHSGVI